MSMENIETDHMRNLVRKFMFMTGQGPHTSIFCLQRSEWKIGLAIDFLAEKCKDLHYESDAYEESDDDDDEDKVFKVTEYINAFLEKEVMRTPNSKRPSSPTEADTSNNETNNDSNFSNYIKNMSLDKYKVLIQFMRMANLGVRTAIFVLNLFSWNIWQGLNYLEDRRVALVYEREYTGEQRRAMNRKI